MSFRDYERTVRRLRSAAGGTGSRATAAALVVSRLHAAIGRLGEKWEALGLTRSE